MSDSREAFEKWAEDKSFVLNIREQYGYKFNVSFRETAWETWQAAQAQAQAVNQQTLSDIINLMIAVKGAIRLGCYHEAYVYLNAAIAAAQEEQ